MPTLDLFLRDRRVGVVEPAARDGSRVVLAVDNGYSPEILLSESFAVLPGRRPDSGAVSAFLGGYVPEGSHRARMAAKRRIDPGDLFGLLREFGGSLAGAVTLRRSDDQLSDSAEYEALSESELAGRLKQALEDSDQGIADDSRSTLPGYQPKVLVARLGAQWAAPHGNAHSTHILKPQVPSRPHRIFDEHYSHLLTRRIGLSRYDSSVQQAGRTVYLAIERFDRAVHGEAVELHHQEDLAQALGLDWRDPEAKFQDRQWPSNPRRATALRIAELLGSIPGGDEALDAWIRRLVYTVAIGDNDAHAKNVALMHLKQGTELAQVYDALPNLFQEGLISWDLALAVGGVFDQRKLSVEHLLAEIASWNVVRAARAAEIVTETLTALDQALTDIDPPVEVSPRMPERVRWNVDRLLSGLAISEPKR